MRIVYRALLSYADLALLAADGAARSGAFGSDVANAYAAAVPAEASFYGLQGIGVALELVKERALSREQSEEGSWLPGGIERCVWRCARNTVGDLGGTALLELGRITRPVSKLYKGALGLADGLSKLHG